MTLHLRRPQVIHLKAVSAAKANCVLHTAALQQEEGRVDCGLSRQPHQKKITKSYKGKRLYCLNDTTKHRLQAGIHWVKLCSLHRKDQ